MNDDLELRLRAAFSGQLPAAPGTLHDALDRVTSAPAVAPRGRSRAPWALLGVAALLATGLVVGLSVGSRNGLVAPSQQAQRASETPAASAAVSPAASTSETPTLELTFEATPADGSQPDGGVMDELVAIIRGRLELAGDADVTVERAGGPRVVVRIPGGIDADEVRELVTRPGRVEIVPLGLEPLERGTTIDPAVYPHLLGRAAIDTAEAGTDDTGAATLTLRLTDEAAPLFAEYSGAHVGEYIALALDHEIVVVPVLNEAILGGEIQITAAPDGFDPDMLRRLVAIINAGAPLGTFEEGKLQPIPFVEVSPEPTPAP